VAEFCYFDGAELRAIHGKAAARTPPGCLPHEFVFPSGRRCTTFDELIQACQEDWTAGRQLLCQGIFRQFLASAGRMDLSLLAQEAMAETDLDVALTSFLAGLPGIKPRAPSLELNPHRLILGSLPPDETRDFCLTVINQGHGILHGTVSLAGGTVDGGQWLRLLEDGGTGRIVIKTSREQNVLLRVDTRGMVAGQGYAAKLTVISNGGVVEVPVRLQVAVQPFPHPPFEGVATPREMAERMRLHPKAAVVLLESGDMERWFTTNGWTYPVRGTTVRGVAAVQQFFETMGLSRPPVVQVSETQVRMNPQPPEVVRWQVTLFTESKKWVYGLIESDVPWLKVLTPAVSGPQQAAITFEVDSGLLEPNRAYAAQVTILANAGQALTVHVRVDVQKDQTPFTRRLLRPFLTGTLAGLAVRGLLVPLIDLHLYRVTALAIAERFRVPPGHVLGRGEIFSPFGKEFFVGFVFRTFWVGALVGVLFFWWRRGVRWLDLTCGAVVGAAAGLFAAAALGSGILVIDRVPMVGWRWITDVPLPLAGGGHDDALLAWWLLAVLASWMAAGGVAGVLLLGVYWMLTGMFSPLGRGLSGLVRLSGGRSAEVFALDSMRQQPLASEARQAAR
jgi:hypothetical protein